jgi:spore coat polysaccharide biosynthesis protein SpsF
MKTGAIVQARTSSKRFPGKILKELPYGSGITVLQQVIRRLKRAKQLDDIIIATTTSKEDKSIIKIAKKEKINFFRGNKENVLSRYYFAAKKNSLDVIVRITGDCPCVDPEIVDFFIQKHIHSQSDYTSSSPRIIFPRGYNVEVLNFLCLEKAYRNAKKTYDKEHVTPYVFNNRSFFKINFLKPPKQLRLKGVRVTLDKEEDYGLLCVIFDNLYYKNKYFTIHDVLRLYKDKPWLKLINKNVLQKQPPANLQDELKQATKILKTQELKKAAGILKKYLTKKHQEDDSRKHY